MSPIRKPIENPYSVAVAFIDADRLARQQSGKGLPVRRALRWSYLRVASLDAPYGARLDALGATMAQVRWVAAPGMGGKTKWERPARNAEVEARFNGLVALLEGRSSHATFRALVAAMPAIDPRNGATETVATDAAPR